MREDYMRLANLSRRTMLIAPVAISPATTATAVSATAVLKMNRRLIILIEAYGAAEADQERAYKRTYPDGRKPNQQPNESDEAYLNRLCAREDATGFSAACDALDAAYERVYGLTAEIVKLPSVAPHALALKARACLWESPLASLRHNGFEHVASLLQQLLLGKDDLRDWEPELGSLGQALSHSGRP